MFDKNTHTLEFFESEWRITKDTLLYERFKSVGLTENQICGALWATLNTCKYCHDDNAGCQCWNDDYSPSHLI